MAVPEQCITRARSYREEMLFLAAAGNLTDLSPPNKDTKTSTRTQAPPDAPTHNIKSRTTVSRERHNVTLGVGPQRSVHAHTRTKTHIYIHTHNTDDTHNTH